MIARIFIVLVIIFSLVSLYAQDNLPVYSGVEYEVEADSLLKTNQAQDLVVTISSTSSAEIDVYEIKIYDLKIFWTLVSANLNDQPVWLVYSDSKSDKDNVLSWFYDTQESLLRIYPSSWQAAYTLALTIKASVLEPAKLSKVNSKLVSLEVNSGGQNYMCDATGSGGEMTFRRKKQSTR